MRALTCFCTVAAAFFGLIAATPQFVWAHARTSTFGTLSIHQGQGTWVLRVAAVDLLSPLHLPETLKPQQAIAELLLRKRDVQAYVSDRLHLSVGARACVATSTAFTAISDSDRSNLEFTFSFACPYNLGPFNARYDLFFDLDPLASGFVNVRLDG